MGMSNADNRKLIHIPGNTVARMYPVWRILTYPKPARTTLPLDHCFTGAAQACTGSNEWPSCMSHWLEGLEDQYGAKFFLNGVRKPVSAQRCESLAGLSSQFSGCLAKLPGLQCNLSNGKLQPRGCPLCEQPGQANWRNTFACSWAYFLHCLGLLVGEWGGLGKVG